jgi:hypothetical protein
MSREMRRLDVELGRRAEAALAANQYTTKSSLGRLLGFSHTHVGNLIDAARTAPPREHAERVPVMDNTIAGDYVTSIGARIVRSVSGFDAGDVLVQSGLDPRLFASADDDNVRVPYMLWQLDSGDWLGVGTATVGYGGTGCGYSRDALTRAGVSEVVANEIVRWRFCDAVDIDDEETWIKTSEWPVHSRSTPSVVDDTMIVLFGDGLRSIRSYHDNIHSDRERRNDAGESSYPSVTEEAHLEAWLRFLDDAENLPEWAQGPRTARVFRNENSAAEDGFTATSAAWGRWGQTAHPCVVIEQGHVQLWGFYYRPSDTTQYLPAEAYAVLGLANVYPTSLAERDERETRPWSRFIANFVPQKDGLPDRIDISATGSQHLVHHPTVPVTYSG